MYSERPGDFMCIPKPTLQGTVTFWVIIGCVGIYVTLFFLNLLGVWSKQASYYCLGLSWKGLLDGMVWQIVTSTLLHFNVPHLVFNMLILAFLGADVEQRMGKLDYIVFSFLCSLAGSVGFMLVGYNQAIGAGYSGVAFGVMTACAIFWPDRVIRVFFFFPMKMIWAMLLMALMELFLTIESSDDAIGHSAHLGGAVVGYIYIKFWLYQVTRKQSIDLAGHEEFSPSSKNQKKKKIPAIRVPDEL